LSKLECVFSVQDHEEDEAPDDVELETEVLSDVLYSDFLEMTIDEQP